MSSTATKPPTLDQFARLILAMREAQRHYFRHRSKEALDRAKVLERRVDETLTSLLYGGPAVEQRQLFEEAPDAG